MTSEDFKLWRKKMDYTQAQAGAALGLSRNAIVQYEKGSRLDDSENLVTIPQYIALACAALSKSLTSNDWQ